MSQVDVPVRKRGRPASLGAEPGGEVQSLDRAVAILEVLASADGLPLSEVGRRLSLPTSTVHRLVSTMERRELLKHDIETGLWTVGVGLFRAGSAYLRVRKLPEIGWPLVRQLNASLNETVNLSLLDGRDVVCVAQAESHEPVRAFFRLGCRLPIHASGAGKALLAASPPAVREEWLASLDLVRFTERTHQSHVSLKGDLARIAQRGFAVDDEEHAIGMRCAAAVIYNEAGGPVGAVSISAPTIRLPLDRLDDSRRARSPGGGGADRPLFRRQAVMTSARGTR